jgi:peroxiredoxin
MRSSNLPRAARLSIFGLASLLVIGSLACRSSDSKTVGEAVDSDPTATVTHATVGELAPDFQLPDANGQYHRLSGFRGKTVVLEWHNHDCPFVVKFYSVGAMQAMQREYRERGVIWLTINSSSPGTQGHVSAEGARELTERRDAAPDALLLDPDGVVGRMYDARTSPHMFVIDPQGRVAYDGAIDSIRSSNPDDIERAEPYLRNAVEAVLAGREVEPAKTRPYGCSVKYAN